MIHDSIVFSADDFGKSATANKNILDLVKLGEIRRVSIMVSGKFSKEEADKLLRSKVKLDIHLELPQSPKGYGGMFTRSLLFMGGLINRKNSRKRVENHWEKQVEKFIKIFNKIPDGLNSHEHVHFFPPYFKIALKLCQKYKIPYIRFGSKGVLSNGNKIGWMLKILNLIVLRGSRTMDSSDYLISLDWIKNPEIFFQNTFPGSLELVCHPERREEYKIISNTVMLG